jgi:chromosome segregation ATPase
MNNYIDYEEMNTRDFTQKDLMLHLLQVTQHTVTREELKDEISKTEQVLNEKIDKLDKKIDKVEANLNEKIDKLDIKIDKVEANLNEKIDKLDKKIDKVEIKLENKIDKVDKKVDRIQWLIVATMLTVLLKDYIFTLFK